MKLRDLDPRVRIRSLGFPLLGAPTPVGIEAPPGPDLGDRYDSRWARTPLARTTRIVAQETLGRAFTTAMCRPAVTNLDRLENLEGPAIFVANHHSHLDTGLVIGALPRPWRHEVVVAAAADYFFDTRAKAAAAAWFWGAVPMERKRVSRRSALAAAGLIDSGWSIVIFPEGGRSPDGWGQTHKGGAAYLAARCDVPVVPIHLEGTNRVLPRGARRPSPGRVTVNFGSPMRHGDDDARRFAARIEASLEELAHETATDWYTARRSARRGGSPSLRGPGFGTWRDDWARAERDESDSARSRGDGPFRNRASRPATGSVQRSSRDRTRGTAPW